MWTKVYTNNNSIRIDGIHSGVVTCYTYFYNKELDTAIALSLLLF